MFGFMIIFTSARFDAHLIFHERYVVFLVTINKLYFRLQTPIVQIHDSMR